MFEQNYASLVIFVDFLGNAEWYPLIEEAKIDVTNIITKYHNVESAMEVHDVRSLTTAEAAKQWLCTTAASLMQRTLSALGVPLARHFTFQPFQTISLFADDMRLFEMKYFECLDGIWLYKQYCEAAHSKFYCVCVCMCVVSSVFCSLKECYIKIILGVNL
jgi:hypothetical protein